MMKPARSGRPRSSPPSVLSFTKLEIPELEVFEAAPTFDAGCDPVQAHELLSAVFGQRAGQGNFLFCADSTLPGRFWVRSAMPWPRRPAGTVTALDPKRVVIQLAPGLMYHFTLPVCAGREVVEGDRKQVYPFETERELERWFTAGAAEFGLKPLMFSAALKMMRFKHRETSYRIDYAMLDGAIEVADPERMKRCLLYGLGSHRRAGLGMLQLSI